MALPRSHRSAFQSVKNKENRDLVSQNPQNFLACGAASRSLRLTITRAGVLAVVHLVATPFRITTQRSALNNARATRPLPVYQAELTDRQTVLIGTEPTHPPTLFQAGSASASPTLQ